MAVKQGKNDQQRACEYLDQLQRNAPELFSEPLQKSRFTEETIKAIEKELCCSLPKAYAGFLQSYKLPESLTVTVSFCGDYACCYEPAQEGDLFVTLEMVWYTASCDTAEEFLSCVRAEDVGFGEPGYSFLEAGFLKIAEFEGYLVFLDLASGAVVNIYHEAIYDRSIADGMDAANQREIRDWLLSHTLCRNFSDFLRLACTKEIYDEDCMEFKTADRLEQEQSKDWELSAIEKEYGINEIKEQAIEAVMVRENMTKEEAVQYLADLLQITVDDFKKGMQ